MGEQTNNAAGSERGDYHIGTVAGVSLSAHVTGPDADFLRAVFRADKEAAADAGRLREALEAIHARETWAGKWMVGCECHKRFSEIYGIARAALSASPAPARGDTEAAEDAMTEAENAGYTLARNSGVSTKGWVNGDGFDYLKENVGRAKVSPPSL